MFFKISPSQKSFQFNARRLWSSTSRFVPSSLLLLRSTSSLSSVLSPRRKQRYGFHWHINLSLCVSITPHSSVFFSFLQREKPSDMTVAAWAIDFHPSNAQNIFSSPPPPSPLALNIPFSHYESIFPLCPPSLYFLFHSYTRFLRSIVRRSFPGRCECLLQRKQGRTMRKKGGFSTTKQKTLWMK